LLRKAHVTSAIRMTSLNKRLAYLGIADFDYLAARVLLRDGLIFSGLPRAAEAFEKIVKLNLILEAKITRNAELEPEDLKRFGHDLPKLLTEFTRLTTIAVEPETEPYFAMLEDSLAHRYPEHWKTYKAEMNIAFLDHLYAQFRNLALANFPAEERERARCFGTFLGDAYTPDMIARIRGLGGRSPWDLLAYRNESLKSFDLDLERTAKRFP
jgi:hypothetical protein